MTPHGTARYEDGILTITTLAKRGPKMVPNRVQYRVCDVRPDPRVADTAFALHRGILEMTEEGPEFLVDGTVYHLGLNELGPFCDCGHANFRGANSREVCKHCLSLVAVGLLRLR